MIARSLALLVVGAVCALTAAQPSTALTPKQRLELYQRNQKTIESLVEKTVVSAKKPNDYLARAESYYDVLYQFNSEIAAARMKQDMARVNELTKHLARLLEKGLAPTLESARMQVAAGGTGHKEFVTTRDHLVSQFDTLLSSTEDRDTKQTLEQVKAKLLAIPEPKK